jgi:hypothetical protein
VPTVVREVVPYINHCIGRIKLIKYLMKEIFYIWFRRTLMLMAFFMFFILTSCVDEYWPEVGKYENLLVVEGGITNEVGPYTIKISKSSPIDSSNYIPYPNCNITISDDIGRLENLVEINEGEYVTSFGGIQGEIGRKYKITISTPDSKTYESDYEELIKPVLIERVYAEIEYHDDGAYDHTLAGYQFYLDTETSTDTNFYLWQMEATFHFQSDFGIRWYFDGRVRPFNPSDSLFNCWTNYKINDLYTFNTTSLLNDQLLKFPLNYVNTEGKHLTKKYSLLVKQNTISKKAFQFWDAIKEQNSDQGSLYSHQPYQIKGNIRNIDDDEEPVLGYFMVNGVDSKRIFVDRIDAPFYYTKCTINDGSYKAYAEIGWTDPLYYPVYVILYENRRAVPGQPCVDCRQKNGSINKPEFWED